MWQWPSKKSVGEVEQAFDLANFQRWDRDSHNEFKVLDWIKQEAREWSLLARSGDMRDFEFNFIRDDATAMIEEIAQLEGELQRFIPGQSQRVRRALSELKTGIEKIPAP